MRALIAYPLAVVAGFLPRRYWDAIDLPIENVAPASSLVNIVGGAVLGITGYFAFMEYVLAQRLWTAPPMMIHVYLSYVFLTPRGLFSMYLVATGLLRFASWFIGEPIGDPILTMADAVWRRLTTTRRTQSERNARLELEREEEPDRRYEGSWAGLEGVDFVIVAARRKPGWTKGTWVITGDGWFTLGEPFDRPMPNGLRTIYPLTIQTTLEVLRKGVDYELPPLRKTPSHSASRVGQDAGAQQTAADRKES